MVSQELSAWNMLTPANYKGMTRELGETLAANQKKNKQTNKSKNVKHRNIPFAEQSKTSCQ